MIITLFSSQVWQDNPTLLADTVSLVWQFIQLCEIGDNMKCDFSLFWWLFFWCWLMVKMMMVKVKDLRQHFFHQKIRQNMGEEIREQMRRKLWLRWADCGRLVWTQQRKSGPFSIGRFHRSETGVTGALPSSLLEALWSNIFRSLALTRPSVMTHGCVKLSDFVS